MNLTFEKSPSWVIYSLKGLLRKWNWLTLISESNTLKSSFLLVNLITATILADSHTKHTLPCLKHQVVQYLYFLALFDAVKVGEKKIEGKWVGFNSVETIMMTSYDFSLIAVLVLN